MRDINTLAQPKFFAVVAVCFLTCSIVLGQQGEEGELQERIRAPLTLARIPINEPSLIAALGGSDKRIATSAAAVLGTFPESVRSKQALLRATRDEDELLAVTAMYSLKKLGNTDWAPTGDGRVLQMHDEVIQLQLAGLLARVGNAKGWPLVVKAIKQGRLAVVALDSVTFFDGLRFDTNENIDCIKELQVLQKDASPEVSTLIEKKIDQLKGAKARIGAAAPDHR